MFYLVFIIIILGALYQPRLMLGIVLVSSGMIGAGIIIIIFAILYMLIEYITKDSVEILDGERPSRDQMEKYRIVSLGDDSLKKQTYHIQKKGFWGWRMIHIKENKSSTRLSFNSYGEAEFHLLRKYCLSHGEISQPYPNEYHYRAFSYYMQIFQLNKFGVLEIYLYLCNMKKTLLLTSILCVFTAISQTEKDARYLSYVSPNKDTLILPNDDIGYMISDSWKDTVKSQQPKILFATPSAISVMNRRKSECED